MVGSIMSTVRKGGELIAIFIKRGAGNFGNGDVEWVITFLESKVQMNSCRLNILSPTLAETMNDGGHSQLSGTSLRP